MTLTFRIYQTGKPGRSFFKTSWFFRCIHGERFRWSGSIYLMLDFNEKDTLLEGELRHALRQLCFLAGRCIRARNKRLFLLFDRQPPRSVDRSYCDVLALIIVLACVFKGLPSHFSAAALLSGWSYFRTRKIDEDEWESIADIMQDNSARIMKSFCALWWAWIGYGYP